MSFESSSIVTASSDLRYSSSSFRSLRWIEQRDFTGHPSSSESPAATLIDAFQQFDQFA